jgi:hypothetical protein
MTRRIRHYLLALVLASAGWPLSAWAQQGPPQAGPQGESFPSRSQRVRAMSESVRRVQRSVGGQVLGAERVQFDGRDITRVKVMDDRGRVRYVDDDPWDRTRRRGGAERNEFRAPNPRASNPGRP